MKDNKIRIGLAQVNPVVGDIAGNERMIRERIARAEALGVSILAFPELVICGYPTEDLLLKPGFVADCEMSLRSIAASAGEMAVIVGAPEAAPRSSGVIYNTAAVLHRGSITARYRKMHLPNYGVFDEKRYFAPGSRAMVVEFGDLPVGISICEDIWIDEGPTRPQAREGGARVIINISASPWRMGKGPERERLMRRRARENGVWLCYVNLLGGQDELVFDGSSVICAPDGATVARGVPFAEDLIVADILPGRPGRAKGTPSAAGRRGKICAAPDCGLEKIGLGPLPARTAPRLRRRGNVDHLKPLEEVYSALVLGTRDYVMKNGFKGVILGLSGGIDSALVAAVAVDALGPGRVKGLTMPSGYTSKGTLSDAKKLAFNLGIELYELPIGPVYESFLSLLGGIIPRSGIGVTEENLQARVRGTLLMAFSNRFGWLVLTTGNKSEVAVGYCTLYGDMAGGFAVLKDVPKTLVFSLARHRNRKAGTPLIPASTIRRKPTAELRPGQCDQDTLPPYPVLDKIIELYVEEDLSFAEIVSRGLDPRTVSRTIGMIDSNEYKRRQAPPGIKITPKAFGRDRRLPITNRYRSGGKR
ncbi:MAG: NAD+ synthase [Candidatus Krumholzibacteria bacterium]|jgi:NAD+ synthase (glutamine-hydrolysing)|nr:NAD+ synthase [Candidatus Krumholzibacteria bacterium]